MSVRFKHSIPSLRFLFGVQYHIVESRVPREPAFPGGQRGGRAGAPTGVDAGARSEADPGRGGRRLTRRAAAGPGRSAGSCRNGARIQGDQVTDKP